MTMFPNLQGALTQNTDTWTLMSLMYALIPYHGHLSWSFISVVKSCCYCC